MDLDIIDRTLWQVRELLTNDNVAGAIYLIKGLLPADQADVFEDLAPEQQQALLPEMDPDEAADILEEMEDEAASDLASQIAPEMLAYIVDEMEPDEAADLLGDLDPALSQATLAAMAEPEDVRPLLLHPDETAGGLMTSEYLAYPQQMRAGQVLAAIRQWPVRGHDSAYLFTVDREGRLAGAVNLFDVLRTDPQMPLSAMMDRDVLKARVDDDQEVVARLMSRYGLAAVPVVDADDRLVGVITVDDLVEVLEDEATEDIQRIAGTSPLEQPYLDAGITSMAWKRMGWLLFLFFTALLTGSVISRYEGLLSSHVILTVFLPLLIGTGGNAGSQTTATVIRALAVGDVALYDFPRVLWREMRTAIVLGVSMAALAFPAVLLWGTSPIMAGVVALSTIGIVIWANSVGSLLPLVAAKVGIDPALVSAPLMSTLVDAVGLLIYFNIAALLLRA